MNQLKNDEIRQAVRQQYSQVAETDSSCCAPSCCTPSTDPGAESQKFGYSAKDVSTVPEGSNMGLGCGNPKAIAALKKGEVVLDLGSGGGFDCFLAADEIGDTGRVIGVDMTPAMISKARINAEQSEHNNVEFRLGEIENLPVADATVDVIISNCVINLSPDKPRVFEEAYRALKPGGRLAISDVVAFAEMSDALKKDMALYTGCMAGATMIADLEAMLTASGFTHVKIVPKDESKSFISDWAPGTNIVDYVVSATIEGIKPMA